MSLTRRRFLRVGAAAPLAATAMAQASGEPRTSEKGRAAPLRSYKACIIGHTGRGAYGHGLDTTFQKIPGVTVAAVADPDDKGRAEAMRKSGAARGYSDWREMLEKEKPDLISIGPRWVEGRLEMLSAAARARAHVYMEKPIAASLQEADAMVEAAEKGGIQVAVAHQARLAPVILHLKRLVDEGLIGELLEMRTRGKEDKRSGGEDLMVLGTHCLYLMRLFGGEPLWCSARITMEDKDVTPADRREATEPLGPVAGDTIHATYAFARGVQGHFASQKCSFGQAGRFQIALHGSKGIALVHIDPDPKVFFLPDPTWSPGRSGAEWRALPGAPANTDPGGLEGVDAANKRIVEDLLRSVQDGGRPACGIHEARATLEMIHAVYWAHLGGCRVAFPLKERRHPLA